jgi:transcriptional regulator of acetoin/glycerol metabolism
MTENSNRGKAKTMQSTLRDYWSIWKQFVLHGVTQEDMLPPALMQSWRRCVELGLDPYGEIVSKESTHPTSTSVSHKLLSLVRPAMEDLYQFIEGSECVVVFADAEARIIDTVGDQVMQGELEHLGLNTGASWSEERQGSNAFALALQESFPIQVDGAMHFRAALHPLYTSAAPVHDLMGQAVGVLAVIGRHEDSHLHTLGMITAAAQAVSNQLQMQVWLSNANDLLFELKTILQTLPEGILLLRHDGVVSQMNAPAGTMLGLTPSRVTGRRLQDVLPLPAVLVQAITRQQSFSDEELVFDTIHGRVTCLCSLKPITSYRPETGLEDIVSSANIMISEPVAADGFVMILRSIERVQKLVHRMTGARARLTFANVVGESPALREALRLAKLASNSNSTVLLHGETGTGKEIFVQSIHNSSARADGPFVAINCAAIPRELIKTQFPIWYYSVRYRGLFPHLC